MDDLFEHALRVRLSAKPGGFRVKLLDVSCHSALVFLLCGPLLLAGCGGGGGDGGGTDTGGPIPGDGANEPPLVMPMHASADYTGNTEATNVSRERLGEFISLWELARNLARGWGTPVIDTIPYYGTISEEEQGSVSGTASYLGDLSGETRWINTEWIDFDDGGGVVYNGTWLEEDRPLDSTTIISFDVTMTFDGGVERIEGGITGRMAGGGEVEHVLNLTFYSSRLESEIFFDNVVLSGRENVADYIDDRIDGLAYYSNEHGIDGRIYRSENGYVDLETESRWGWPVDATELNATPVYGGGLSVRGAGKPLLVVPLNAYFAGIAEDADINGSFETGNRFTWTELTGEGFVPYSPLDNMLTAHAGIPEVIYDGREIFLSGLLSHAPGNASLTYEWRVLEAPANSYPILHDANLPLARLEARGEKGPFLVELTVSDGEETRSDTIVVQHGTQDEQVTRNGALGSVDPASVGDAVHFDGRTRGWPSETPEFTLFPPPGSSAILNGDSEITNFVPDTSGFYVVRYDAGGDTGDDYAVIAVDTPFRFHQPHFIRAGRSDYNAQSLEVVDIDGDGAMDVLTRADDGYEAATGSYLRSSGGLLNLGSTIDMVAMNNPENTFLAMDIDRGERSEVIAHAGDRLELLHGEWGYYPQDPYLIDSSGCMPQARPAYVVASGDINGDGYPDLAYSTVCEDRIEVRLGLPAGGLDLPIASSIANAARLFVTEINGDGFDDIVMSAMEHSPDLDGAVLVALSNGDGTFESPVVVATGLVHEEQEKLLAVGDINGDAYSDIVTVNEGMLTLIGPSESDPLATRFAITNAENAYGVAIGDINNDGRNDILFETSDNGGRFGFLLQNSDGSWADVIYHSTQHLRQKPRGSRLADVNTDGMTDIIYIDHNDEVGVMFQRGK